MPVPTCNMEMRCLHLNNPIGVCEISSTGNLIDLPRSAFLYIYIYDWVGSIVRCRGGCDRAKRDMPLGAISVRGEHDRIAQWS